MRTGAHSQRCQVTEIGLHARGKDRLKTEIFMRHPCWNNAIHLRLVNLRSAGASNRRATKKATVPVRAI